MNYVSYENELKLHQNQNRVVSNNDLYTELSMIFLVVQIMKDGLHPGNSQPLLVFEDLR